MAGLNLCIDIGNTSSKAALFQDNRILEHYVAFSVEDLNKVLDNNRCKVLISKTGLDANLENRLKELNLYNILRHSQKLPVELNYKTPEQLMAKYMERVAA